MTKSAIRFGIHAVQIFEDLLKARRAFNGAAGPRYLLRRRSLVRSELVWLKLSGRLLLHPGFWHNAIIAFRRTLLLLLAALCAFGASPGGSFHLDDYSFL